MITQTDVEQIEQEQAKKEVSAYEKERQRQRDIAAETMKDHKYTCLCSSGGGAEVWQCCRPGSSIYAFNIIVTTFGIAVVGDIDGLLFNVGSNYGIPFLAGDDISYYIHSKLESACRETEYDPDGPKRELAYTAALAIQSMHRPDVVGPDKGTDPVPAWIDNPDLAGNYYDEIKEYADEAIDNIDLGHEYYHFFDMLQKYMEYLEDIDNDREAYDLLNQCQEILPNIEPIDVSYTKTADSVIRRLYLVNHAAKEILKIKAQEAES